MNPLLRTLCTFLCFCVAAAAQGDLAKKEADLQKTASGILTAFARTATTNKVGTRAKQALDLILEA